MDSDKWMRSYHLHGGAPICGRQVAPVFMDTERKTYQHVSICAGREHRVGSKSLLLAAGREDGRDFKSLRPPTTSSCVCERDSRRSRVQTAGEETFRVTELRAWKGRQLLVAPGRDPNSEEPSLIHRGDQIATIPSLFSLWHNAVRTTGTFDASSRCKVGINIEKVEQWCRKSLSFIFAIRCQHLYSRPLRFHIWDRAGGTD
jgi:hypothetical protein